MNGTLAVKTLLTDLLNTLNFVIKIVNHIRGRALRIPDYLKFNVMKLAPNLIRISITHRIAGCHEGKF